MSGQTYAYDGVLGGKTGYTEAAGNTLVTFAHRGNMYLVSVVMQSINGAYSDTKSLLDYGFDNFSRAAVKEKKEISFSCLPAEKYLIKDYQHCVLFYSMRTPSVALPNGTDTDSLKKNYTIKKNPAGRPLLTINYSFNGHQVGTARYYRKNSISDLLL